MFELYVNSELINCSDLISKYRTELSVNGYIVISSNSPIDHVAAYLAWIDVPGTLVVLPKMSNPTQPSDHEQKLLKDAELYYGHDVIVLTTSGTTAPQSLVAHPRHNVDKITHRSAEMQLFDTGCRVGGNLPPFTSGFYHILLQPCHYLKGKLHIWDWNNQACPDMDHALISAGQLDVIKARNIKLDLSRLKSTTIGASPVLEKHGEFLLSSGARTMRQIYGLTQLGSPFLTSAATADPTELPWLDTNSVKKYSDLRFVNHELQVKNTPISLGEDLYTTNDGWFMTGDYWHIENNKIKFDVRSNEKIRVNDYTVKLSLIEEIINKVLKFDDCMAIKKTRLGFDFLHIIYHASHSIISIDDAKDKVGKHLPQYAVPLSFEKVVELPRTALGKKKRW